LYTVRRLTFTQVNGTTNFDIYGTVIDATSIAVGTPFAISTTLFDETNPQCIYNYFDNFYGNSNQFL